MKIKQILKYRYISFDIFDTIIKRNVKNPKDVFLIVEKKYEMLYGDNVCNYYKNRIIAEIEANKICKENEITINDIYNVLEKYYSKDVCNKLKEIEKNTEINICVPNKPIIDIYNEVLNKNKNLLITSDMYLDENTIKSILNKCGIVGYKKIYLSSSLKKRKIDGTLFNYICNDLKIKKSELIHIGDNILSDFIIPKIKGIGAIHIKNKKNNLFYNKNVKKKYVKEYNNLENFISNSIDVNKNYYYKMGYETFGPILYGVVDFINDKVLDKNNMFFLSRDGYIIKKAFKIINPSINTHYFYASRRALIVPTLWKCSTFKEMINKLYIGDYIKVGNILQKLGIEPNQCNSILQKYKLNLDDNIKFEDIFKEDFQYIFQEMIPIIHENSKKEYQVLTKYIEQEGFSGNVSIFDIGWNGNMQKALADITSSITQNIDINGYYVGVVPESKNIGKINMKGFLFENTSNRDIYVCEKVINPIFESMFLAPHGSVKKYKLENEKVEPLFYDYEFKDCIEKNAYEDIQSGALQFINDFINSDIKYIIDFNAYTSFYNMMKFAYKPNKIDVEAFGNFKFFDDEKIYIAKPKKIKYYIMHPKDFYNDLYNSGWKIGFLKRMTKINFFYKQIYLLYVKKYLYKRKQIQK